MRTQNPLPAAPRATPQQSSVPTSEATFWMCSGCNWVNGKADPQCKSCGRGAASVSATGSKPSTFVNLAPANAATKMFVSSQPVITQPKAISTPEHQAPSSEATFWICSGCNWVNGKADPQCKSCGKGSTSVSAPDSKPYTPSSYYAPAQSMAVQPTGLATQQSSAPSSDTTTFWSCPWCNWVNGKAEKNCKSCGNSPSNGNVNPGASAPPASAPPASLAPTTFNSIPNQGSYSYSSGPSSYSSYAASSAPQGPMYVSGASSTYPAAPSVPAAAPVQDDFVSGFANHIPGRQHASPAVAPSSFNTPVPSTYNSTSYNAPFNPSPPVTSSSGPKVFGIREKFWGLGDNFSIVDQNQQPVYKVKGRVFAFGDKLSFQDLYGTELAFISQQMSLFQPKYKIMRNGKLLAEVIKEFTLFNQKFTVEMPGRSKYSIEGSFWQHEFAFKRQGRQVARVSKQLFAWTDSYAVQITTDDDNDVVPILCTCIVIDQVLHDG